MPKFKVDITRTSSAHTTIEIEADDIFEARLKAQDTAGDYTYNEKDADYEVGTATEIKEDRVPFKITMYMHIQSNEGDIEYHKLETSTLDPEETCKAAATLYELTPNMVCVMVYDIFGQLHFEQKVKNYVNDVIYP